MYIIEKLSKLINFFLRILKVSNEINNLKKQKVLTITKFYK